MSHAKSSAVVIGLASEVCLQQCDWAKGYSVTIIDRLDRGWQGFTSYKNGLDLIRSGWLSPQVFEKLWADWERV